MPAPTNSPDINVTKYAEVASTAIHRIAVSRPNEQKPVGLVFFGAYILEKVYKYCGNGDSQDSVTYRHGFDISAIPAAVRIVQTAKFTIAMLPRQT
mgnify:CR=1 FL=1